MPTPFLQSSFAPENREAELGQEIVESILEKLGEESIEYFNVNPKGSSVFIRANGKDFFLSPSSGEANQVIPASGSSLEMALWSRLTPETRAELSASNPELARKFAITSPLAEGDAERLLRWDGYLHTGETLKPRVEALRDAEDWIEGLVPKRSLGFMVGDSAIGKSALMYQQAFAIAAGVPFCGRTTRQGRVLVVDFENGQGQVLGMLQQFAKYYGVPIPRTLYVLNANDVPPEWESTGHTLIDMIQDIKPDVAWIDSLGSAYPDVESKNANTNKKFKEVRAVISSTGASIELAHHIRKASDDPHYKPERLEDGNLRRWFLQTRGPQALINGSDVRFGVEQPTLHPQADLALRGFRRVSGEIPLLYLKRKLEADGKTPIAYEAITGAGLLFNPDQAEAFMKLPNVFSHTEAKHIYQKGAQATTDWLNKCVGLGILRKTEERLYEKVAD